MNRSLTWVRRHVSPIGLDLGARVIRMIQLAQNRDQKSVVAAAQRSLPAGTISPSEMEELCAQAIGEMLSENRFLGRQVVSALAWDELKTRNLRLPQMPEGDISHVVRFEAADRFGLDPMTAEVRFLPAGDVRQGTEVKQEVIAFGVARSGVERHIAMLKKAGLRAIGIDAGPCAVFRSFERFLRRDEDANTVNVFLDLGYGASRVIVTRGVDVMFFKSIPIGGRRFDELTAEQLEMTVPEAAALRLRLHQHHVAAQTAAEDRPSDISAIDDEPRQVVNNAVKPALEQLAKEILLCLRYCAVTFRGMRADSVTAVGGEACNRDMLRALSQSVSLPVEIGRAVRGISDDAGFAAGERRTGQPEWAGAVGLALKPIDILEEVAS